jgi:hypothetical protein
MLARTLPVCEQFGHMGFAPLQDMCECASWHADDDSKKAADLRHDSFYSHPLDTPPDTFY